MRKLSKTSKIVVAGVAAGTLALSGIAYAFWTNVTQASAVGGAVSANTNTLTLSTGPIGGPGLVSLPTILGGSTNVHVYATNVTQTSQILTDLTAVLSAPGCTQGPAATSDFTIVNNKLLVSVPSGPTGVNVDQGYFTVTLNSLGSINQDACQGSVLSFTVTGS